MGVRFILADETIEGGVCTGRWRSFSSQEFLRPKDISMRLSTWSEEPFTATVVAMSRQDTEINHLDPRLRGPPGN